MKNKKRNPITIQYWCFISATIFIHTNGQHENNQNHTSFARGGDAIENWLQGTHTQHTKNQSVTSATVLYPDLSYIEPHKNTRFDNDKRKFINFPRIPRKQTYIWCGILFAFSPQQRFSGYALCWPRHPNRWRCGWDENPFASVFILYTFCWRVYFVSHIIWFTSRVQFLFINLVVNIDSIFHFISLSLSLFSHSRLSILRLEHFRSRYRSISLHELYIECNIINKQTENQK